MNHQHKPSTTTPLLPFNHVLLFSFLTLLSISIVMVASTSISIAERYNVSDFYFVTHHIIYVSIGLSCFFLITLIPIKHIEKLSIYGAVCGLALLSLVFIPGLSRSINGAYRFISLGFMSFQPSELAKLTLIIYLSGYLVRRQKNLINTFSGVLVPLTVLLIFDLLLLFEPDFGSVVVISSTILGLLFIAGIKLRYLFILLLLATLTVVSLIYTSNYRLERVIAFLNPWDNQFDKGYQLVQSLIAFGRGGWFGTGLGGSVQKLLYLPEAYTDFIFAIIAEELGFVGASLVLLLFSLVIIQCLKIAKAAMLAKNKFAAFLTYGISLWLGIQSTINIGVNIGLLPTKGLTLPFISYGGNSLLTVCIAMALVFRVDFEVREYMKTNK